MHNANNGYLKTDFVRTQLLPRTLTITEDTKSRTLIKPLSTVKREFTVSRF